MTQSMPIRVIDATTFHFTEPGHPCTYWSNGDHIVPENGTCRCGKRFMLAVVEAHIFPDKEAPCNS